MQLAQQIHPESSSFNRCKARFSARDTCTCVMFKIFAVCVCVLSEKKRSKIICFCCSSILSSAPRISSRVSAFSSPSLQSVFFSASLSSEKICFVLSSESATSSAETFSFSAICVGVRVLPLLFCSSSSTPFTFRESDFVARENFIGFDSRKYIFISPKITGTA